MMTLEQIKNLAREVGFESVVSLETSTIQPKQEVRDMCVRNSCGQYAKRWSCPPGCGDLGECAEQLRSYREGILVQTVGKIEDSFDIEGMQAAENRHKERVMKMYVTLRKSEPKVLALGSGCCIRCEICTYPIAPCRFPEEMITSMEAYGILVTEICKANQLQYYYGPEQIAYTSCLLFG